MSAVAPPPSQTPPQKQPQTAAPRRPAIPAYAPPPARVPWSQRINFRAVLFGAIVVALVGYPVYLFLDEKITGGVKNRGDYLEVNLQEMSLFPFDQVAGTINDVPAKWRALDGKRVLLTGEMWNPYAADETDSFDLCYSIAKCCFNGPPQVQHFVKSKSATPIPYYQGQVAVLGTLHVDVKSNNGRVAEVYHLDVEKVTKVN